LETVLKKVLKSDKKYLPPSQRSDNEGKNVEKNVNQAGPRRSFFVNRHPIVLEKIIPYQMGIDPVHEGNYSGFVLNLNKVAGGCEYRKKGGNKETGKMFYVCRSPALMGLPPGSDLECSERELKEYQLTNQLMLSRIPGLGIIAPTGVGIEDPKSRCPRASGEAVNKRRRTDL